MTDAAEQELDVFIVGGGPVGLLSAIELTRRGIKVRVIERAETHTPYSKASVIHVRNQELLAATGIIDQIRAVGHPMHATAVNAFGKVIGELNLQGVDSPFVGPWIIFQSETEEILINHLASLGVDVEWQKEFQSFEQQADGVKVTIRDVDGHEEVVSAKWLLGCDGSGSQVRDQAGIAYDGRKYDEEFQFQLADVDMTSSVPKDKGMIYMTKSGAFVLLVPQYDHERIILTKPRDEPLDASTAGADAGIVHGTTREVLTLDELQTLTARYGPSDADIRDSRWLSRFRIHVRLAREYRANRVIIAGDAAHIHVPMGGQGMNTGFGDAVNLAWKLALVVKGRADESLLNTYKPERRPVAKKIVESTDKMFIRISKPSKPFIWAARNIAPLVFPKPKTQNRIRYNVAQFNIQYENSTVVEDLRGRKHAGPIAGDRAPDAVLGGSGEGASTIFDAVLPEAWFSLVVFEGGGEVDLQALETAIAPYRDFVTPFVVAKPSATSNRPESFRVLEDVSGDGHRRYGAEKSTIYLIRPDKYIGFCADADGVDALRSHLGRILK